MPFACKFSGGEIAFGEKIYGSKSYGPIVGGQASRWTVCRQPHCLGLDLDSTFNLISYYENQLASGFS